MKRSLVIGVVFLLICLIFVSTSARNIEKTETQSFDGNILYVGGSGGDNYTKIQDAIDDANPGDTVFVFDYSSPYYERVNLNKRIDLVGEDKNTTVIDAQHNGNVVTIQADDSMVNGFTLRNCKGSPNDWDNSVVMIVSRENIVVKDNIISIGYIEYNDNTAGVFIDSFSSNCLIQNNIVYNGEIIGRTQGVMLHDGSSNNNISGNEIYGYAFGVGMYSYTGVEPCSDNVFYDNDIHNNNAGIHISGARNSEIYNNKLTSNRFSGIDNILATNTIIAGNIFINNGAGGEFDCGLKLDLSSNSYVANNIFSNNNPYGIYLLDAYKSNIVRNNFIDNSINAIFSLMFRLVHNNKWDANYWSDYSGNGIFPKIIFGEKTFLLIFTIPWINLDWHPANEPYDIEV